MRISFLERRGLVVRRDKPRPSPFPLPLRRRLLRVRLQRQRVELESVDVSYEAPPLWNQSPSRPQSSHSSPAGSPRKTLRSPVSPVPPASLVCSCRQLRTVTADASSPLPVARIGDLRGPPEAQGYFIEFPGQEDGTDGTGDLIYREMNLLDDPCLSFALDRYDIFKSLSSEDIQTVVEVVCPNILRKVVNSAKRLRAHLQLDEGDVFGLFLLNSSYFNCIVENSVLKDTVRDAGDGPVCLKHEMCSNTIKARQHQFLASMESGLNF